MDTPPSRASALNQGLTTERKGNIGNLQLFRSFIATFARLVAGVPPETDMVQVLMTIFFSATALAALGVVVSMIADNAGDIRNALGIGVSPAAPQVRVFRVRRGEASRAPVRASAGSSLRAAA